jgi:cytoskeleton protein RodZ
VSLFQRIKTPFAEVAEDGSPPPHPALFVGELLREHRQELGLDLEAVGEALRIKPIYLMAIEQGRTEDLPGPTYAIGFVRAYAHYLGLDVERVLESYKAGSAEVQARPDLSLPVPLGARSVPGGPILLVGLILALCGYGTWYYLSTGERNRPERVAPLPAELQPLLPQSAQFPRVPDQAVPGGAVAEPQFSSGLMPVQSATPPATPDPGAAPPDVAPDDASPPGAAAPGPGASAPGASSGPGGVTPVAAAGSGDPAASASGSIEIHALADCWIQIRAPDQSIVFSRVLKAGETYRVSRSGLSLRTGNAGALAVMVDGKPAPALGGIGTLRRNVLLDPEALLAGTAIRG